MTLSERNIRKVFPEKRNYGAIMAELPYIMAPFLSAAINNFHIFMAIYGYGRYGVPIPASYSPHYIIFEFRTNVFSF